MSDEEREVNYAKRQKIVHYGQVDSKASAAPEEGNVQVIQWCTDLVEKFVTAKFSIKSKISTKSKFLKFALFPFSLSRSNNYTMRFIETLVKLIQFIKFFFI